MDISNTPETSGLNRSLHGASLRYAVDQFRLLAHKLERERDEARYREFHLGTELDSLFSEHVNLKIRCRICICPPHATDEACPVCVAEAEMSIFEECDQLRKVCDELAHAIKEGLNHGYGLRIGEEALVNYNQLPHVTLNKES